MLRVTCHAPSVTPRLLLWSLAFNLPLTLLGLQRHSADYYSHLFFADHYRLRWWDLWEPRWYTGFSVASYPPLVHQLIALCSRLAAPASGIEGAERLRALAFGSGVVQMAALLLFPLAVRSFAALFVGPAAARQAGLLAIFFPGLSLAVYSYGQLPTLVASVVGLFVLASGGRYLQTGETRRLTLALLGLGIVAGAHHAVFLLIPWAGLAVAGRALLTAESDASRRAILLRAAIWAGLSVAVARAVLWPFVNWSQEYQSQTPIDHPSRHNFLVDPLARRFFFWPVYGWLIPLWPLLIYQALRHRRLWSLGGVAAALSLLGLGGTTPLPQVLFGPNWAWLTYDRFALWGGICWLPLAGLAWSLSERRARESRGWLGRSPPQRRWLGRLLVLTTAVLALISAYHSVNTHSQPPELEMVPILDFLEAGERSQWRYYTFGFGDQLAKLSILAPATTPDGSYHTARTIPELRSSGIGQIDSAVWNEHGVEASYTFMQQAARWGVRWAFVNHPAYVPLLERAGWRHREKLSNGVEVWELEPTPPSAREATPAQPVFSNWLALWWGIVPLTMLLVWVVMYFKSWQW